MELAYPPSGGKVKLLILGVLLPVFLISVGVQAWITGEAIWIGRYTDMVVHGRTAKAIGFAYANAGLFCHFRWFWGLLPKSRVFEIGTIISTLGFLGGLGMAVYYWFCFL